MVRRLISAQETAGSIPASLIHFFCKQKTSFDKFHSFNFASLRSANSRTWSLAERSTVIGLAIRGPARGKQYLDYIYLLCNLPESTSSKLIN